MQDKIKLPIALLGGAVLGHVTSSLSSNIINRALIKNAKLKTEEFKSSLSKKQSLIYSNLISRLTDIERFGRSGDTYDSIKDEIYVLKRELEGTLSKDQIIKYNELEKLNTKLANKVGYTNKASMALGALAVFAIAYLNKNN